MGACRPFTRDCSSLFGAADDAAADVATEVPMSLALVFAAGVISTSAISESAPSRADELEALSSAAVSPCDIDSRELEVSTPLPASDTHSHSLESFWLSAVSSLRSEGLVPSEGDREELAGSSESSFALTSVSLWLDSGGTTYGTPRQTHEDL